MIIEKQYPDMFFHTPDKTLVVLVNLKEKRPDYQFKYDKEYADYYLSVINDYDLMTYSNKIADNFGNAVILNDYENYLPKTCYLIIVRTNTFGTEDNIKGAFIIN